MENEAPVDLQGQVWMFDGRRVHSPREFRGTRISLIWFCHTSWRQASEEQTRKLEKLGFVLPRGDAIAQDSRVCGLPGTMVNGALCKKVGYLPEEGQFKEVSV